MHRNTFIAILSSLLLLGGCSTVGSGPEGVTVVGNVQIEQIDPDVTACDVFPGLWFSVEGQNLGTDAEWQSGVHKAIFPPGIEANEVGLIETSRGSSIVHMRVPLGVESGTLILEIAGSGSVEIPITVDTNGTVRLETAFVSPICQSNPPPSD